MIHFSSGRWRGWSRGEENETGQQSTKLNRRRGRGEAAAGGKYDY